MTGHKTGKQVPTRTSGAATREHRPGSPNPRLLAQRERSEEGAE